MAILFFDCYDSFTYNLVNLIEKTLGVRVAVVHNDSLSLAQLHEILPSVDAVVIGPGPGHPAVAEDAGLIPDLWKLSDQLRLPILGVCFGHQSLALSCGAKISRLPLPRHGQYGEIKHNGTGLFEGIPDNYQVILYHSLHAVISEDNSTTELEPLAYSGDKILMAVKHRRAPYYGVQFHPESILSTYGPNLITNFWNIAQDWNSQHRPQARAPWPAFSSRVMSLEPPLLDQTPPSTPWTPPKIVKLQGQFDPLNICDKLHVDGKEFVLLHSAAPPGNWTIIGLLDAQTIHVRSRGQKTFIGPLHGTDQETRVFEDEDSTASWRHVAEIMGTRMSRVETELPFIGGMMGYITYEKASQYEWKGVAQAHSDTSFVFVENCILVRKDGQAFAVGNAEQQLGTLSGSGLEEMDWKRESLTIPAVQVSRPDRADYIKQISRCKEYLLSGDSYELCLTAETQATFNQPVEPWKIFKHLVQRNPAPYSTFMNFDDTLVGTSPERFMSWDSSGLCQFRPIKGTVRKGPTMTFNEASQILNTPKERAENLMILDLIRHDLGYLLSDVQCTQLMKVEEYETVYQLVSVIEGHLGIPRDVNTKSEHIPGEIALKAARRFSGFDVMLHSLPPGSMTGAPKKRSVEILRSLEKRPRGLYSGVSGYWSLNDTGDWSVIIRSAFRYKGEQTWRMGAGGAITVLSEAEAEFEEMETKLESALQAFSN